MPTDWSFEKIQFAIRSGLPILARKVLVLLPFTLDTDSSVPAYRQICDQIIGLVDRGVLPPGHRLPATRRLGPELGVHRSTVVRAYDELRSLGYLESEAGSYSTVRRPERLPTAHIAPSTRGEDAVVDWEQAIRNPIPGAREYGLLGSPRTPARGDVIDLDRLAADPRLAPDAELRRSVRQGLKGSGSSVFDYAEAQGTHPLREALSTWMLRHGVAASPDEILVTAGAQRGLDLILRFLTRPGDRVVVEAPTYGLLHPLLALHGVEAVEVPMRADGVDLDRLEQLLGRADASHRPRAIYTMPTFHNPTGITTPQSHRERLLLLCEAHRLPIVEDGFEEEMKYTGKMVLPVKSMDSRGIVLYVGTFSKVVFPGLRVGWIAAPRGAVRRLTDVLQITSISGNTMAQTVAARFCAEGGFDAHLRRIHRIYRGRMRALLAGLEAHLPSEVEWTRPKGGYTTWLTLPDRVSEKEVVAQAEAAGVRVGAGRRYFGKCPSSGQVRLSISCADEDEIGTACRRLGTLLREMLVGG